MSDLKATKGPWKTSMICDRVVCRAYYTKKQRGDMVFATDILKAQYPDCPMKVIESALLRAEKRGLLDYGVTLRSGWLTDKGYALIYAAKARGEG